MPNLHWQLQVVWLAVAAKMVDFSGPLLHHLSCRDMQIYGTGIAELLQVVHQIDRMNNE